MALHGPLLLHGDLVGSQHSSQAAHSERTPAFVDSTPLMQVYPHLGTDNPSALGLVFRRWLDTRKDEKL